MCDKKCGWRGGGVIKGMCDRARAYVHIKDAKICISNKNIIKHTCFPISVRAIFPDLLAIP